ncbi:MAG: hypothetical protein IT159_05365 [Bryobacterales bacterium]|nr:hypothetical protein [Bryobacterales bacterium]
MGIIAPAVTAMPSLGGQPGAPGVPVTAWKIEKLTVAPVKQGVRSLTASVLRLSPLQRIDISAQVVLSKVDDAFIWEDRLVLLGEAGRASGVEIFDLARKAKVDWFYCYQPSRISDNWIAYKEFYHGAAQGPVVPIEVLLVYDLARTPSENRMEKEPGQKFPLPTAEGSDSAVEVGVPVYPESNVRLRSYQIVFETVSSGRFIDAGTFALLPSKQLIFRCTEQWPSMGIIGSREYLVVVDLSRGLDNPRYHTIGFPRMGKHITNIVRIEADTPRTVRLVFPKGEYNVDSMVVALPEF